jgi:hypothetical protein
MIDEKHLLRVATLMLERHGLAARSYAEFRADHLACEGEPRAALTWRFVMRIIDELARAQARTARENRRSAAG